MAGGRGLSVEEKRQKLLEIFHETKEFYQLKEIEKLGSKKGVVAQTVKEVLQTLVDDGLVQFDKIGSANFYWSFPSARGAFLTHQVATTREELATLETREAELNEAIEGARAERQETASRTESLVKYTTMKQELSTLKYELSQYETTNPEQLEQKRRAVMLAKEAATRWTDNIEYVLSWCSSTLHKDAAELRAAFSLPDDFDTLPAD